MSIVSYGLGDAGGYVSYGLGGEVREAAVLQFVFPHTGGASPRGRGQETDVEEWEEEEEEPAPRQAVLSLVPEWVETPRVRRRRKRRVARAVPLARPSEESVVWATEAFRARAEAVTQDRTRRMEAASRVRAKRAEETADARMHRSQKIQAENRYSMSLSVDALPTAQVVETRSDERPSFWTGIVIGVVLGLVLFAILESE